MSKNQLLDYLEHMQQAAIDRQVNSLAIDLLFPSDAAFVVILADGREVSVPIEWSPRLQRATPEQRNSWRLIGGGIGIHWEDIDEDISVESILRSS